MDIVEWEVVPYEEELEDRWDDFVMNHSVNGTFLQTRRFLNYHESGKFIDSSFVVLNKKGKIAAVCPACKIVQDDKCVLYSHMGSTFGGLVFGKKEYTLQKITEIIEICEQYIHREGFDKILYKITCDLFCAVDSDLLRYALYFEGYTTYQELNLYVDFLDYKDEILSNFSQGKRTNVHNCIKENLILKKLETKEQIVDFYHILSENLKKYDRTPVHSVEELLDFKDSRLIDECDFYGVYKDSEMIAGGMLFYFNNTNVVHTQYLCAKAEYNTLSPMTFMYYSMITEAKKRGANKISWGITTEHYGKEINWGLTKSKEAFGSKYMINYIYEKELF